MPKNTLKIPATLPEPNVLDTLQASAAPVQVLLVCGRANTGKSEACRAFNEFCEEAGVIPHLVDLDTLKQKIGSLSALYGARVKTLKKATDGRDIAEYLWPLLQEYGKGNRPVIVDCPGSDTRLLDFAFRFDVKMLAKVYNLEIIVVFVVSADAADWQYLEQLESKHSIGAKKIVIFNEKFEVRDRDFEAQCNLFRSMPVVQRLCSTGTHFAALPNEEYIQKISKYPIHRGMVGKDDAISRQLADRDPELSLWRQTQVLTWYRTARSEFPADAIRLPWHV